MYHASYSDIWPLLLRNTSCMTPPLWWWHCMIYMVTQLPLWITSIDGVIKKGVCLLDYGTSLISLGSLMACILCQRHTWNSTFRLKTVCLKIVSRNLRKKRYAGGKMRNLSLLRSHLSLQISNNRTENQTPERKEMFTGRAQSELLLTFVDILMGDLS